MRWLLVCVVIFCCLAALCSAESRHSKRNLRSMKHDMYRRKLNLLKRLIELEKSDDSEDKETVPLSNDELKNLMDKIPTYNENDECLSSEKCASDWMEKYNELLGKINEKSAFLEFNFETDINDQNEQLMSDFAPIANDFQADTKKTAFQFLQNSKSWDAELKRMYFIASQGVVFEDEDDVKNFTTLANKLESIYATAKVCLPEETEHCLSLEPELTDIMQNSRDYDELLFAWRGWHEESGRKMRHIFAQTVELENKAAVANNYTDLSEYWISDFEDDQFEKNAEDLLARIKPLYDQIHAYVRAKLEKVYGTKYPANHDPKLIPAHLLGNMWAQTWENIFDLVKPYPEATETNLTQALIEKNYTAIKMFKEAEKFFVSIGLYPMTPAFWKNSMIEKPEDRDVVCHASAIDLFNGFDYRIKMCTVINDYNFAIVHHEMGHIEYYMSYNHQPAIFKYGANSAFHEAIGDTIALSVLSPTHLKAIDLIADNKLTKEQEINQLMKMALMKVAFLPFAYLMDKWRWDVFRGKINETNYNQKWWQMRAKYQGLEPPLDRSEADFDPGAKFHIANYVPYARYFISHFLQFQFYRALCKHAGHEGPLYQCDFYNSPKAGSYLKDMLSLGSSKHWSHALELISGENKVSADALLEYFKPLEEWLKAQNEHLTIKPGF